MGIKGFFRAMWTLVLAGAVWLAWQAVRAMPAAASGPAMAEVRRGPVVLKRTARGELRAGRTEVIYAPRLPGVIKIARMARPGTFLRAHDLVVEFDAAEQRTRLEEKKLDIERVEELIQQEKADEAISENQDEVDLLAARFAVRRAELDAKRNELLPPSEAQKNLARLEDMRRSLARVEEDQKARREHARGRLEILEERKRKSVTELEQERREIEQTRLTAPFDGLVRVATDAPGFGGGTPGTEYLREGDEVGGGSEVAEVLDLTQLQVVAPVRVSEAAFLKAGQEAEVLLDALPETALDAQVTSGGETEAGRGRRADPGQRLEMRLDLDMTPLLDRVAQSGAAGQQEAAARLGELVRPGMLGGVEVFFETYPDAVVAPAAAVVERDGEWLARVVSGGRIVERKLTVLGSDGILTVVGGGLQPGEMVLIDGPGAGAAEPQKERR